MQWVSQVEHNCMTPRSAFWLLSYANTFSPSVMFLEQPACMQLVRSILSEGSQQTKVMDFILNWKHFPFPFHNHRLQLYPSKPSHKGIPLVYRKNTYRSTKVLVKIPSFLLGKLCNMWSHLLVQWHHLHARNGSHDCAHRFLVFSATNTSSIAGLPLHMLSARGP